jgi:hypothetical protein
MHVGIFLHKLLSKVTHKKRIITLILLVEAVLVFKQLSVTRLGRALSLRIQERSCIKRADRLIGNEKLHSERKNIYHAAIKLLVSSKISPRIIVDWSAIPNSKFYNLRAALAAKGRALTLYEEVHPEKKLGNRKIQNKFLHTLRELLPRNCKPIIVTDAGFTNSWFKAVLNIGYDFIGRIRNNGTYYTEQMQGWSKIENLCKSYNGGEKSFGKVILCKVNSLGCYLYITKEKSKKRFQSKQELKKGDRSVRNHRKSAKEALVVVSSLHGSGVCKKVISIYQKRMQIEEAFRDLKSSRYGFGFEQSYSRKIARIEIMLLVAMLASMVAWLVGLAVEKMKLHYQFQVNSIKFKRVLSLFFLGCQAIKRKIKIPIKMLEKSALETCYGSN